MSGERERRLKPAIKDLEIFRPKTKLRKNIP